MTAGWFKQAKGGEVSVVSISCQIQNKIYNVCFGEDDAVRSTVRTLPI